VSHGDGRDTEDRDWRQAEADRRRRMARAASRRRGRLRLAALVLAIVCVTASAILAARAASLPAPYARAALASVGGTLTGSVAVIASRSDNAETATASAAAPAVTWDVGRTDVSSTVTDGALNSIATASFTNVSLLDGRITATSIELVADAASTRTDQSGGVFVSRVEGLAVDGQPVALDALPLTIAGLGTLYALESREASEGLALEEEVSGLRLHLTDQWKALPEGSDIVVGMAAACADRATARRFLPKPVPEPKPTHPAESSGGNGGSGGGTGGSEGSGGSGGGSSSSGGGSGASSGSSSSADNFRPGKMAAPGSVSRGALSFPGAVFPVDGQVWYSDDFGAPRPVGGGHTGNDIFARRGTPVVAVQAGVIQELRYRSLGGNSLHLVNVRGDYFYYAHLLRYAAGIDNGTTVQAGEVLGYVGNTGNAITTPSHLHFEIHPGGGGPVDPYPYLALWRGDATAVAGQSGAGPSAVRAGNAVDAEAVDAASSEETLGRHERATTVAGIAAPPGSVAGEGDGLLPAAISLGVFGGLTTTAVRRRRAESTLISMDLDDLRRARSGS
jgi:murein DD-endopeptidase MepM/ murein hydrolase activator NlpD